MEAISTRIDRESRHSRLVKEFFSLYLYILIIYISTPMTLGENKGYSPFYYTLSANYGTLEVSVVSLQTRIYTKLGDSVMKTQVNTVYIYIYLLRIMYLYISI